MKITSRMLISIALGVICATLCWSAMGLGLLDEPEKQVVLQRTALTQSTAISCSILLEKGRYDLLESALDRVWQANRGRVRSIGVRSVDGDLLASAGEHESSSIQFVGQQESTVNFMVVDFKTSKNNFGRLEVLFRQDNQLPIATSILSLLFVGCGATVVSWFYLTRVFNSSSSSGVVPARVRSALDTLAEGLLLVDGSNKIVLANRTFVTYVGRSAEELVGMSPDTLDWKDQNGQVPAETYPWHTSRQKVQTEKGRILILENSTKGRRNFLINAAPIEGPKKKCLGVLISFDDVTQLEAKKEEMAKMLNMLRSSRDEIQRTNQQLVILASSDPLTGCFNRRAFFEKFETAWARDEQKQLGVIMVDLDHFKSINDNHGHSTGDEVLKEAAQRMRQVVGDKGVLARYGGEEFCVLLEAMTPDQQEATAEQLRRIIEEKPIGEIKATGSIGLSIRCSGALDPQHLLDQADQCLYVAKRRGRNQVVRFDLCTREELALAETPEEKPGDDSPVHYHAVSALLSSLAYRDRDTAMHSCRVANLCVLMGQGLMPHEQLYELEVAALLHDIGKIGVPDAVLLKPGKLDPAELEIMKLHDEIGVNIARSACANENVIAIIEHHHDFYEARAQLHLDEADEHLRTAMAILPICDAFDAMTNDRVYRKGLSIEFAINELRRGANKQFDPKMVQRFEQVLAENPKCNQDRQVVAGLSKTAAIHLGGLLHKLASATDEHDVKELKAISADMKRHGDDQNSNVIVRAALRLEQELERTDADVDNLCQIVGDVMDLCRSARDFIVDDPGGSRIPGLAEETPCQATKIEIEQPPNQSSTLGNKPGNRSANPGMEQAGSLSETVHDGNTTHLDKQDVRQPERESAGPGDSQNTLVLTADSLPGAARNRSVLPG